MLFERIFELTKLSGVALCMCSFLKKGTWEPTLEKRATMSAMVACVRDKTRCTSGR